MLCAQRGLRQRQLLVQSLRTEERGDAGMQLGHVERLQEKIVRAGLEPLEHVRLTPGRGEDDDGSCSSIRKSSCTATGFEPRHLGHVPVEHEEVGALAKRELLEHRGGSIVDNNAVLRRQRLPRQLGLHGTVVHDPDACRTDGAERD